MKKIFAVILVTLLCAASVSAATWCAWDGTKGTNCQSDSRRYLIALDGHKIAVDEVNLNSFGFYERTITDPTIGADQIRDAEIWSKVDNQIGLAWGVRDLTATEIDQRIADPMSIEMYYVWKALLVTGLITAQQAINYLPAEMINAYQARKRLLGD